MADHEAESPLPPGASTQADPARARFLFITAHRLIGAVLVVLGMLAMEGAFDWGKGLGKVFAITGLIVFFVVPLFLARAWRSPRP